MLFIHWAHSKLLLGLPHNQPLIQREKEFSSRLKHRVSPFLSSTQMSNSRLTLSYSFSQAPTHLDEATPPRVGKGHALAVYADQVGAGQLWTGAKVLPSVLPSKSCHFLQSRWWWSVTVSLPQDMGLCSLKNYLPCWNLLINPNL